MARDSPAEVSLAAMRETLPGAFRNHYHEFGAICVAIAKSDLPPKTILPMDEA
jgi:hypothetical protein